MGALSGIELTFIASILLIIFGGIFFGLRRMKRNSKKDDK